MTTEARINAICPYFTMYPLNFPLSVLEEYAVGDSLVVDPFCGRGTTSLAARLRGLPTVGVDTNPLAVVVTQAKLSDVTAAELRTAFEELIRRLDSSEEYRVAKEQVDVLIAKHEFWRLAFSVKTLTKLMHMRRMLQEPFPNRVSAPLQAIIAGALHGPMQKTKRSYLSNQAPRTFAPKPDYAVRFWKARSMNPPEIEFEAVINERIDRYFTRLPAYQQSKVVRADSRYIQWNRLTDGTPIELVVTSPPYFGMLTYSSDQWLRLWFLGGSPSVDYSSRNDFSHSSSSAFAQDLRKVWTGLRTQSSDNAHMVIRMGSIPSRQSDPRSILENSLYHTGWKLLTLRDAGDPRSGKRQHDHFGRASSFPAREIDVHCVASG